MDEWIKDPRVIVSVMAAISGIGYWVGQVNSDRKSLKECMDEIRKDIKDILGRLPSPRPVQGASELRTISRLGIGRSLWRDRCLTTSVPWSRSRSTSTAMRTSETSSTTRGSDRSPAARSISGSTEMASYPFLGSSCGTRCWHFGTVDTA